jgi:hypothetical protein
MAVNCGQLLSFGFLIAVLVFVYTDSWIAGDSTYVDFIKAGTIVCLCMEFILACLILGIVACVSADHGLCAFFGIILMLVAILFTEAYYIAAAFFFADESNFTAEAPNGYRVALEVIAIVVSVVAVVSWVITYRSMKAALESNGRGSFNTIA